jgi:hypothetical protein
MSNVKKYTDKQLWDRVLEIGGKYPKKGHLSFIAVQSNEDAFNMFDDKIYVYIGRGINKIPKFFMVSSVTTNSGSNGLLNFKTRKGVFVWKLNKFYTNVFEAGYHHPNRKDGGMKAFRLIKPVYYYRDNNRNKKAEQIGRLYFGNRNTNMHGVSYNPFTRIVKQYIFGWSLGCIVWNNMKDYHIMIDRLWKRGRLADFTILEEF